MPAVEAAGPQFLPHPAAAGFTRRSDLVSVGPMSATNTLEIGSEIAGHRIEAIAGRGGMGVVYKATDLALKRIVALKLIAPSLAQDPEFRQRFKQESELAASLDHPNVVPIYTAGESDGLLYVTMRFVEGTDLREMIAVSGALEPELATRIISQVASALDAAHKRGLVHRDIKPANILISGSKGAGHAYLTDFGLTKKASSQSGLTKTGMIVGTMDYIAPEQLQGSTVDARADIYALACVLYQALSGQVPYPRDSDVAKMWGHMNEEPAPLPTLAPSLPSELVDVVTRGMAKDPADRFPSAGDFGRAAVAASSGRETRDHGSVAKGDAAPNDQTHVTPPNTALTPGFEATQPDGSGPGPGPPPAYTPPPPLTPPPISPTPQPQYQYQPPPPTTPPRPAPSSSSSRKPLIIGIVGGLAALVVVALLVVALSGGSSKSPNPINVTAAQTSVQTFIKGQTEVGMTATCPGGDAKSGATFTCQATNESGDSASVLVTQTDDSGTAFTDKFQSLMYDSTYLEDYAKKFYAKQQASGKTKYAIKDITCPATFSPKVNLKLDCPVTFTDNFKASLPVTITNIKGSFRFNFRKSDGTLI